MKEIAIAHSVTEARECKQEKLNLEREFHNILSCGNSNTADDHVRLAEIKDLLKAIEDRTEEGAIIRSREQWIEFGEKPTKYFYQLEQKCRTLRERNFLTREMIRAKNSLCQGDQNVSLEIKELENALSSLVIREAESAKIRSGAKWRVRNRRVSFFVWNRKGLRKILLSLFLMRMASKNLLRLI